MTVRNPQALAEERSLAYHREIAARLAVDSSLVPAALSRIERWSAAGSLAPTYAARWRELLALPTSELVRALIDPGEHARALRQCSPFAGALDPRTRWRIHRQARASQGTR